MADGGRCEVEMIQGSARGARVGGAFSGLAMTGLTIPVALTNYEFWPAEIWLGYSLFLGWSAYLIARPWFMGVWVGSGSISVRSWYRTYRYAAGDIDLVEVVPYWGLINITAVPWAPFVGSLRMLRIRTRDDRTRDLPATGGRLPQDRNT